MRHKVPFLGGAMMVLGGALSANGALQPSADGLTVYDTVNKVTWLADFNLPRVVVSNIGTLTSSFTATAQAISPSFFVLNGGPYVAAVHLDGRLVGPASLFPGSTTPAKPGETISIYANSFGPTSVPVAGGSVTQGGVLSPLPVIMVGGKTAAVQFAGLVSPGLFQFNVAIPANITDGDQPVAASYSGQSTQAGTLITVQH